MKIAIGQINIKWEDKKSNMEKIEDYIRKASIEKVDIILFPEMSLTGFSMNIMETRDNNDETMSLFKQIAIKYNIAIGIGFTKANKEKAENHYAIINKNGECLSDYIKIHPFSYVNEDEFFVAGDKIALANINDTTIGTTICYDLRFPELFQAISKKANIIIVPANWPAKRKEHWECLLKARAIENQTYIVGVNCVLAAGEEYYAGNSCIINPSGEILKELEDEEGLILYEIPDDVEKIRNEFPTKKDRRENLYKNL